MLSAIILTLLFISPGFIAASIYLSLSKKKAEYYLVVGIIFDFLIFTINSMGLFFFKSVYTVTQLTSCFRWISFFWKYTLLSILVAIILGVISGILSKLKYIRKRE
ncbi:MAG: hypothetical protein BWY74_00890 [Firmicutes bacterium ADurb.Bin419]|nr:MAG: hypothetical protein BWY74_00890 [Firmicutes bacterium ADurb.Bin419]